MKIFAFYLPQFHEIEENNRWWGKGFTEWTRVKEAKSLFDGHCQPKHPLNGNYYDLLNIDTVKWQTDIAHQYGVDGFIYYHYYFKGKLLLEKPAENLLRWTDVSQSFFFCWANHAWIKTWEGKREILLQMEYGDEEEWEKHFIYLLDFFKDRRYEKKDNMPLLMVYNSDFEEKEKLFAYFDKRCKEEGFDGLWLIEAEFGKLSEKLFRKKLSSTSKAVLLRDPDYTKHKYYLSPKHFPFRVYRKIMMTLIQSGIIKKTFVYSGQKLMTNKIRSEKRGKGIIHSLWFEWDNTPRHSNRGYVITPYKKQFFWQYMNSIENEEFLFINAWNEWAEGMMLEPTEEEGYRYLEWIREWKKAQL